MQKYSEKENALRLGKRTKRYLAAITAVIMALSISSIALADNGKNGGQPGGQGQNIQGGGPGGQQGNDATSSATTTNQGNGNANGQGGNKENFVNTDKIEEAIAALTDTDTQTSLTTLLETYEAALAAKQTAIAANNTDDLETLTAAVTAAQEALDTALAAAGVDKDTLYSTSDNGNGGKGDAKGNRPALNTDEIETAIAALTDTDVQANLTTLLATYKAALAAQTAADTSTLTDDEIQALADAVKTAESALLEATRTAGISSGEGRGQFVDGHGNGVQKLNTEAIAALIAALDDTDDNKATLTDLLTAYETALVAETTADTTSLTADEIAALSEATKTAADALKTAMTTAGIAEDQQPSGTPQPMNQQQSGKEYQTSVISQTDNTTQSTNTSIVSSFLKWLSSILD